MNEALLDHDDWIRVSWAIDGQKYLEASGRWREFVYPFLIRDLDASRLPKILDYGAGDGSFLKFLVEREKAKFELSAFEPHWPLASHAIANLRGICQNVEVDRSAFDCKKFDYIIFSAVWMSLTHDQAIESLAWMRKRLADEGRIMFSITHPCFRNYPGIDYTTNFNANDYCKNGEEFEVYIDSEKNDGIVLLDRHYTLADIFEQILRSGLRIETFYEVGEGCVPTWICGSLSAA